MRFKPVTPYPILVIPKSCKDPLELVQEKIKVFQAIKSFNVLCFFFQTLHPSCCDLVGGFISKHQNPIQLLPVWLILLWTKPHIYKMKMMEKTTFVVRCFSALRFPLSFQFVFHWWQPFVQFVHINQRLWKGDVQQCLGLGGRSSRLWVSRSYASDVFPQPSKQWIFLQYFTVNKTLRHIETFFELSQASDWNSDLLFSSWETSRFFWVTTREHSKKTWFACNYTRRLKTHLSRLQFGSLSSHTAYPFPNISGGIGGDAAAGWVMRSISVSEGSEGALTPVRLMARTRKRSSYNWSLWGKLPAISHNQNNQNGWNKFSNKGFKEEKILIRDCNHHQMISNDILTFLVPSDPAIHCKVLIPEACFDSVRSCCTFHQSFDNGDIVCNLPE